MNKGTRYAESVLNYKKKDFKILNIEYIKLKDLEIYMKREYFEGRRA
jgi:hypothetical protein